MKIVLIAVGILIVCATIVLIIGWSLPVKHSVSRTITLNAPISYVWQTISDFKQAPSWRTDLKSVDQVEIAPNKFAWKEVAKNGDAISFLTLEAQPENTLVRKIADEDLPFGGSWTFKLGGDDKITELSITEDGEVYNPLFRFMSRYVFGHSATMDRYISQLKTHVEGA